MKRSIRVVIVAGLLAITAVSAGFASAQDTPERLFLGVNKAYDATDRTVVAATRQYEGQHVVFFVDDAVLRRQSPIQQTQYLGDLAQLGRVFDSIIYPQGTALWGSEPNPGLDNDPRVLILVEDLKPNYGGYFDTIHQYPRVLATDSNQRDMVFLASDAVGTRHAQVFLAHEFQHLISFHQKNYLRNVVEPVWLNELRSEITPTLLGLNDPYDGSVLQRRLGSFIRQPSDSVVEWPNSPTDYGLATVFGQYLVEQLSPKILTDALQGSRIGIASIDDALARARSSRTFASVFDDWMLTLLLHDPATRYHYVRDNFRDLIVRPGTGGIVTDNRPSRVAVQGKAWQPLWYDWQIASAVSHDSQPIAVELQSSGALGGAVVAWYQDGHHQIRYPIFENGQAVVLIDANDAGSPLTQVAVATTVRDADDTQTTYVAVPITISVGRATPEQERVARSLAVSSAPISTTLVDGALIQRQGDPNEVYVIQGNYKRLLPLPVKSLYGHLVDTVPIEVSDVILNTYQTAPYIRSASSQRLYVIWPDGTKHTLKITDTAFRSSGRDPGAIFVVNDAELAWYRSGVDITR